MKRPSPYKAFFKRSLSNVDGVFTIQDLDGNAIFKRLPARSGQAGFTKGSWTRGKSPIPFGTHYIRIAKPNQEGQWAGDNGIGEFWPIYNVESNTRLIKQADGKGERWDVGLHPENKHKGSAGCIVLINETQAQKKELVRLSKFLKSLIAQGYDSLVLEVFE